MTSLKLLHRYADGRPIWVNMDKVIFVDTTAHGTELVTPSISLYVKESPSEVTSNV